jgi:hypothetical protein
VDRHAVTPSINRLALGATVHCLTGCGFGEVLGIVLGTAFGWSNLETIIAAIILAFAFGYALTLVPLRQAGIPWSGSLRLALAADSASIAIMEVADNAIMLVIPGAMNAPLASPLFWGSLALSLALAGLAAFPVNRSLIASGKGHALIHRHHPAAPGERPPPGPPGHGLAGHSH